VNEPYAGPGRRKCLMRAAIRVIGAVVFVAAMAVGARGDERREAEVEACLKIGVLRLSRVESIEGIFREIGERAERVVAIDEALGGRVIEFYTPAVLDFSDVKAVLELFGVEVIFDHFDDRAFIKVFLQRNTAQARIGNPTPFSDENSHPLDERSVIAIHRVAAGDGQAIAAAIQERILAADPHRVDNVCFVPSSGSVIIACRMRAAEAYLVAASSLDVAPAEK
jgi:hypothetical protein